MNQKKSKKQVSSKTFPNSISSLISQYLKPVIEWYESRESREKYLIIGALSIALLIGAERAYTFTDDVFEEQSSRLSELEDRLKKISVLLNNYNRSESKRIMAQERFSQAGAQSAMLAHLEGVIKRKAKIQSRFEIRRGDESRIGDQFTRLPFTVIFQQLTPGELSNFLKELSSDKERPAILSKLNLTSRGSNVRAEISLDLVARRS